MWEWLFIIIAVLMVVSLKTGLNDLRRDLKDIEREVHSLRRRLEGGSATQKDIRAESAPVVADYEEWGAASEAETVPAVYRDEAVLESVPPESASHDFSAEKEDSGYGFEFNLGAKLPVWIGSVALVFAAFYLVKYSIESGWLQPAVRLTLGAIMGVVLLSAGQWLAHRPYIANALRMAQGLVGAGLVTLYVCLYAGVNLYNLIDPTVGFLGMSGVTITAVVMSLKHGQPIAVFGLLGGLITPALVASEEPNAIVLFTYLFLLFSGMIFILSRKGWWMLASVALMGMFAWLAIWLSANFSKDDALVLVLFAMGLCSVVLLFTNQIVRQGERSLTSADRCAVHNLNILAVAGGVATIAALSFMIELTLFDWSMLGILTLAGYALAFFMPQIYKHLVFAKMGADLVLFMLWTAQSTLSFYVAVASGLLIIYTIIPLLIIRFVRDPRFWAGLQFISSLSVYIIVYIRVRDFSGYVEPFAGFWGVVALMAASYSVYLAQYIRERYNADDLIRDHLLAIYALAATAFLSLGVVIELPWAQVPLAFALQGLATMWVFRKTGIPFLSRIVAGLLVVFLALNWSQLMLLFDLMGASLMGDAPSVRDLRNLMLPDPVVKLGVPALLWGVCLYLYSCQKERWQTLTRLLCGTILSLFLMAGYYLIKDAFHGQAVYLSEISGFLERGLITILIAMLGVGLFTIAEKISAAFFLKEWGVLLFKLAVIRLIYFDLLLLNPYFSKSQFVGDMLLFNGVTMVYGAGLLMCLWAIYRAKWDVGKIEARFFYKGLGFVLMFILVSLNVRQFFHGGLLSMNGAMGNTEFYTYSIAWLLMGLGLLAYGIIRESSTARRASLALMLLTIGKVFFLDAAELEGLFRVFSFLGLGVSLIGLSYFYSRFVFRRISS